MGQLAKATTGRKAGDDPYYTFVTNGGHPDIRLASVTSVIKAVFSPVFQPAAYWGAKQALQYCHPHTWEQRYESFKESELAPNSARQRGATRGTRAHDVLEALAKGKDADVNTSYDRAVVDWWQQQADAWEPVLVEEVVWFLPFYRIQPSTIARIPKDRYVLRDHPEIGFDWWSGAADLAEEYGYAGTTDLFRRNRETRVLDCVDLKTHKPPARYEDHLQISAYHKAAVQMGLVEADWGWTNTVVIAKENGKWKQEVRGVNDFSFERVRAVYRDMEGY